MFQRVFALLLFFITSENIFSQEYFQENFLRYEDHVYKKNIRTVLLSREDWEFSAPVIKLGTEEKLKLSFDDMDASPKNYWFTIIHCDAGWNPTPTLLQSEYISGFFEDNIPNFSYSSNTIQPYVHYELVFPTENLKPAKSGNYLLKVFIDFEQSNVAITRRFMVLDERVNIIPDIHLATVIDDYYYKQEVDFTIQTTNYQIINPYNDLKVVLAQNDRWDNAVTGLQPNFVKDNELVYDFDQNNVFPGGNEFRVADIKSLKWNSEFIREITRDSSNRYHVWLYPDKKRSHLRYFSEKDINGKYKIHRMESSLYASETEAEYVHVHFSLPMEKPVENGSIYVFGALTGWNFSKEAKMIYNLSVSAYEAVLYLKQGYYNYEYVFVQDGKKSGDESYIEGTHYETENDYTIYVYYKPINSTYDHLIGMKRMNSLEY